MICGCKSNAQEQPTKKTEKVKAEKSTKGISAFGSSLLLDSTLIVQTVKTLSSDAYEGRKTGTVGNKKAQDYIIKQFKKLGVKPINNNYKQAFKSKIDRHAVESNNIVGIISGTTKPDSYIGIAAHYDHEGIKWGKIYNGADDNASGVGGLLGIASYFSKNPPAYSIVLFAFDAEESGLQGSYHFVDHPNIELKKIKCLINLDMIARSSQNEIFASGTFHYPKLKPIIEKVNTDNPAVKIRLGHDKPQKSRHEPQDWTYSSDHAPFYEKQIPYIYFGVEDHEDYHKPTDDFEKINLNFYLNVVDLILDLIITIDKPSVQLK